MVALYSFHQQDYRLSGKATYLTRSSFLWQGILILGPALVLGLIGFLYLRQEDSLITLRVTEEAKSVAVNLARVALPAALRPDLPADPLEAVSALTVAGQSDPVFTLAQKHLPGTAAYVSDSGQLLFPPPVDTIPRPCPLDDSLLDVSQRELWRRLRNSNASGLQSWEEVEGLQGFLSKRPPRDFAGHAVFRLGAKLAELGQYDASSTQFRRILNEFGEVPSEVGCPLRLFAALRLTSVVRDTPSSLPQRVGWAEFIARHALYSPSFLSASLLEKILGSETDNPLGIARTAIRIWETHQTSRRVYEAYIRERPVGDSFRKLTKANPEWFRGPDDCRWLAVSQKLYGARWIFFLPESRVQKLLAEVVRNEGVPRYFSVTVLLGGERFIVVSGGGEVVAEESSQRRFNSNLSSLEVELRLAEPARVYGRNRMQARLLGLLVAGLTAAVVVGFLLARRAYRAQRELTEAQGNFVSSVSHELRAPLAAVRLMAEELEDLQSTGSNPPSPYPGLIVRECRRLCALVENVLEFSRMERGAKQFEFSLQDAHKLVEETVEVLRAYAGSKGVEIATRTNGTPLEIQADGHALRQALVNLLDNAIKHSPPGSTVSVEVKYPVSAAEAGAKVEISVVDTGRGIPGEEAERIFERFYRSGSELRRETAGIGLGLAIVKQVCEGHGGEVLLQSVPGKGSRFTLSIPVRQVTANQTS